MKLYHGSNQEIRKPRILSAKRFMDFGAGFYLTSDLEQAQRWAQHTVNSRSTGLQTVSVYEFDMNAMNLLESLKFDTANKEWLHFVASHRTGEMISDPYDIVIGPVANDQVIRTVNLYLDGYITEDMALELLLPQKLKDQYTFKTEEALRYLIFEEAIL